MRCSGPRCCCCPSTWGVGTAVRANAASFLAVIAALGAMRVQSTVRVTPGAGLLMHIAEGVGFIRSSGAVSRVLGGLGVLSLFAMNFNVVVPVLARVQLHLNASGFGFLMAAQGAGALAASLIVAGTCARGPRPSSLL